MTADFRKRTSPVILLGRRLFFWALLSLLSMTTVAAGQPPANPLDSYFNYASWSLEAGLPQVTITAIARGPEGWLWLGTQGGLVRMNGSVVDVFKAPGEPLLGAGWVSQLLTDGDALWIVMQDRLLRWRGGEFEWVADLGPVGEVSGLVLYNQELWIAGEGLWRLQEGQLVPLSQWQGRIQALAASDTLWWADAKGGVYSLQRGAVAPVSGLPANGELGLVRNLAAGRKTLWLGTSQGLGFLNHGQFQWLSDLPVQAMAPYQDALWVADTTGFSYWSASTRVVHLTSESRMASETLNLFASEDGSFWVGSRGQGARYYWRGNVSQWDLDQGFGAFSWTVLADRDRLLIGTERGVRQFSQGSLSTLVAPELIPGGVAYSLLTDADSSLWIGSREGLVYWTEAGAEPAPAFAGLQVNSLLVLSGGEKIAATSRGLWQFSRQSATKLAGPLANLSVRTLLEDTRGVLWAGTETGLWRREHNRWQKVNYPGLDSQFIPALTQLSDGSLVAASYQQGVFISPDGHLWQKINLDAGLPTQGAFSLIVNGPWLWLSNGDGIQRLAIDSLRSANPILEVILYDEGELPGRNRIRCCNGGGNHRAALFGNHIWFPSLGGLVRADLDARRARVPVVKILEVIASGGSHALGDREYRFGATEFRLSHKLEYRYRVIPYNDDWRYLNNQRVAYYTNLPYGEKQFQVQARYTFGQWGPIASVDDYIQPRLYETILFRLMALMLGIALVFLFVRLWTRRLQLRDKWLQQLVDERTQALVEANEKLADLNERLLEISLIDALTGLHNRRFLSEQMPKLLAEFKRKQFEDASAPGIGLFLLDLDYFKRINDTQGHAKGDAVLQAVALHLKKLCRESDILVRWGGEEFLLVQPQTDEQAFPAVATRIRQAVALAGEDCQLDYCLTASLGIAVHPCLPGVKIAHWESALALADYCLYQVKHSGRNGFAYASCEPAVASCIGEGQMPSADIARWQAQGLVKVSISQWGD